MDLFNQRPAKFENVNGCFGQQQGPTFSFNIKQEKETYSFNTKKAFREEEEEIQEFTNIPTYTFNIKTREEQKIQEHQNNPINYNQFSFKEERFNSRERYTPFFNKQMFDNTYNRQVVNLVENENVQSEVRHGISQVQNVQNGTTQNIQNGIHQVQNIRHGIPRGQSESSCQNRDRYHQVTGQENSTLTLCLLYTSPSPRDGLLSRMPSSA